MPADIGEMFYTEETPWHGQGIWLAKPATMEEALKVGGLNWQVDEAELLTAEQPPSPAFKRKAIVRLDRPLGHPGRVVGVVHRGFQPVQNREGALLFDAVFGHGRAVYHTGGYLRDGEVVWLLARINRTLKINGDDLVQPYALLANSHDGSMAFNIRLTTIRVVCRNTLTLAMRERRLGQQFSRPHQGSLRDHAEAAQEFFRAALAELDFVGEAFTELARLRCDQQAADELLGLLLPEPRKPRNADRNPGLLAAWQTRRDDMAKARRTISELREQGKGMELPGSRGTFWGLLNAVLEYVDHHHTPAGGSRLSHGLLGEGMELKSRAFTVIRERATKAA
jgi:phage/plasmid-like protein (TIGR03299 family)